MLYIPSLESATIPSITGDHIAAGRRRWPVSRRAVVAANLASGRVVLDRLTVGQAATILGVGIQSVHTLINATGEDRTSVYRGDRSIRSIRKSSAIKSEPGLIDLWRAAGEAERVAFLRSCGAELWTA
jgi:hypothetical protein